MDVIVHTHSQQMQPISADSVNTRHIEHTCKLHNSSFRPVSQCLQYIKLYYLLWLST